MGLIERLGSIKARRGNTTTDAYSFTRFGYILAWIIERPSKGNIADQKIYDILDYHFRDNPSSKGIFYSTLHKKFKEKEVYGEFVVDILKDRINSNVPISSMTEIFESLILTNENNISNAELYHELWAETMSQMPYSVKNLILHDLKLDIERKMFEVVKDVKRYERLRYELRKKYDVLAMEAKCEKCLYVRYVEISINEYLEISEPTGYDEAPGICPQCQSHNSTITPIL